jgi:hypothetical protein
MHDRRLLAALLVVITIAGGAGCGMFDRHGSRRRDGGQIARCDVDLEQWKARVRHFKDKSHQNRDTFRKNKDDLLRDLDRLDTAACRREIRRQVTDLIDDVRDETF